MASRQNREARKEYPTGHNKGNQRVDDPEVGVRTSGGPQANDEGNDDDTVPTFGAPIGGPPPVTDTTAEREALLATKATPEERRRLIDQAEAGGRAESRARAEEEARNRPAGALEEPSPTADLTATGAAKKIRAHQQQTDEEIEAAGG